MTRWKHLSDIKIPLQAVAPIETRSLRSVLAWNVGDVVPIHLPAGATISVLAEGVSVGEGELSVLGDKVVVRMTRIGKAL